MKYAFIFGSNVFIVPSNSISYKDNDQTIEFLKIKSLYHNLPNASEQSVLTIDTNLRDIEGRGLNLVDNKVEKNFGFTIIEEPNRILVTGPKNDVVLDVLQLDDQSAMDLEHNIAAELEANSPVVAIRVTGDFMLGRLHTKADDEKLSIIRNTYANSVLEGYNGLAFTASGVII